MDSGRRRRTRRSRSRTTAVARASSGWTQVGELLAQPAGGHALEAVDQRDRASLGGKLTSRCTWLASPLNSTSSHSKSSQTARMISSIRARCRSPNTSVPVLRHEHQVRVQQEHAVPAGARAVLVGPRPYGARVQLRYTYRLDPTPGQRQALARAFGCARVVFNDAVAARQAPGRPGLPYLTDAALSEGAHRRRSGPRSGRGWPRCPRWCCSRPWPI